MSDLKINYDITKREKDILKLLWKYSKPLTASELAKCSGEISISTTQTSLKNLMKKGLVEVADIVYSGTVLSRSYKPSLSSTQYEIQKLISNFRQIANEDLSTSSFVATLLEQEKDSRKALKEIEDLEKMLIQKKVLLEDKVKENTEKKE